MSSLNIVFGVDPELRHAVGPQHRKEGKEPMVIYSIFGVVDFYLRSPSLNLFPAVFVLILYMCWITFQPWATLAPHCWYSDIRWFTLPPSIWGSVILVVASAPRSGGLCTPPIPWGESTPRCKVIIHTLTHKDISLDFEKMGYN